MLPPALRRYEGASPADLPAALREWDWSAGVGPFLYGAPGVGKTHAAVVMWSEWQRTNGRPAPFVSVARLLARKRAAMNVDDRAVIVKEQVWREPDWNIVPFVVLDDFDKARLSEWAKEELFIIIDTLYSRQVPVIITSNLTPKQFINHAGPFIGDRVKEMATSFEMVGTSRRESRNATTQSGDRLRTSARSIGAGASDESELEAESDGSFKGVGSSSDGVRREGAAGVSEGSPTQAGRDVLARAARLAGVSR